MPVNPLQDVKNDLVDVTGSAGANVTNVTGLAPITSSGGTTPQIALTTPLAANYGGTGLDLTGAGTGYVKSTAGTITVVSPIATADGGTNQAGAWTSGAVPYLSSATQFGQDAANHFWDGTNHRLGLGTNAPNTTLDINGPYAFRQGSVALVNGLNSNIATPSNSYIRITGPTSAYSVGGFTGGVDGRLLTIQSTVAQTLTIVNEDVSSAAANRIKTLTGANVILTANQLSSSIFIYDSTDQRWVYFESVPASGAYVRADGTVPLTAPWYASAFPINALNSLGPKVWNAWVAGCDNTGAVDCSATINTAFGNGYRLFYFPAGTYKIVAASLSITASCTFFGDGALGSDGSAGTSILAFSTTIDGITLNLAGGGEAAFRDLHMTTSSGTAASAGGFIHTTTTEATVLAQNCSFSNQQTAFLLEASRYCVIRDCRFYSGSATGDDIWINNLVAQDHGGHLFTGNTHRSAGNSHIRQTAGGGNKIVGNTFVGAAGCNILLDLPNGKATSDLIITGNQIEGNVTTANIRLVPGGTFYNVLITGNEFEGTPTGTIIGITPAVGALLSSVTITGNTFYSAGYFINLNAQGAGTADGVQITGNDFWTPTTGAILNQTANATNVLVGPNNYRQTGTVPYISGAGSASFHRMPNVETIFVQTATSVTTANVATTLFGTGRGSLTIPAGRLMAGTKIRVRASGYCSVADGGAAVKTVVLSLGGVTAATGTSPSVANSLNSAWFMDATMTVQTAGAGGTGYGMYYHTMPNVVNSSGASNATFAVNTTAALAVNVTYNNGNATGTITTTDASVELLDY
jgi:hypothetical protein